MRYKSTRDANCVDFLSFEEVLFAGYASDGGLYVPEHLPNFSDKLSQWRCLTYPEIVANILSYFVGDEIPTDELNHIVTEAFKNFGTSEGVIPLKDFGNGFHIAELYHGPTFAFKDLALSVLRQLLKYFLTKRKRHITILVATSGDTGSAAIECIRGINNADIICMYPKGRITKLQELQMITVTEPNVHCFAGEGATSDDLDKVIISLFEDKELTKKYGLCSINSVNWTRVAVQIAHYFYLYFNVSTNVTDIVQFVVPTGGCGHILGGILAKKMGLPIKLTATNNSNSVLYHTIKDGQFSLRGDVIQTMAPAMDIQLPLNCERWFYWLTNGDSAKVTKWMNNFSNGDEVILPNDIVKKLQETLDVFEVNDALITETIVQCFKEFKYLVCPHTATAVACYFKKYRNKLKTPIVCLASASPAKFPEAIIAAKLTPQTDPKLENLKTLPTQVETLKSNENWRRVILNKIENISK